MSEVQISSNSQRITWALYLTDLRKYLVKTQGKKYYFQMWKKIQPPQIQSSYPDAVYIMQQPTMSSLKRIENRNFAGS